MVSPRPAALIVAVVLLAGLLGGSARSVGQAPPRPPIDAQPYAIRLAVAFDPGTRIDRARATVALDDWAALARRFVGEPWDARAVEPTGPVAAVEPASWSADLLRPIAGAANSGVDKVWAVRVRAEGSGYRLDGRELDVATGGLGAVHRRVVRHPDNLPRDLFHLTLDLFAPSAEVGEGRDGGVTFLVRGGSLTPADPLGAVAPVGSVFRVLRIFPNDDGTTREVREVPYSYFRVEDRVGGNARCAIIRGVGDPLTNRYARKNRLVALGIRPAANPTRLRFVTRSDKLPAAGYRLIARLIPGEGSPFDVGTTDRDGRVVLPPDFAAGLVSLRLLAGNGEPMLDAPIMPGESPDERTIAFEARPLTLALEAKLDALRDAIVDVVANRSRLEVRMKARVEGEDWPGLDAAIREFRALTPRSEFETRFTRIQAEGERQEADAKTLVLTKNARARLDEVKALIDRYLDDDVIRSYEDAAAQARVEATKTKPAGKP